MAMALFQEATTTELGSLFADETYVEPSTTGEFLPGGRQRYLEWARRKKEAIEQTELGGARATPPSNTTTIDDTENDLKTKEVFPSKYLVDSDGDDDDQSEAKQANTAPAPASTRPSGRKKSRKTALFSDDWRKSVDSSTAAIVLPSDASGIVCVMGRRIHVDRLIHRNASLYSMLRAWMKDDQVENFDPPLPGSFHLEEEGVRRKTLEDYKEQKSWKATAPKDNPVASFVGQGEITRSQTKPGPPLVVDVLGWLASDPKTRPCTPSYPSIEEMAKLQKQQSARKTRRSLRKKRLAAARERLRRKGIRV